MDLPRTQELALRADGVDLTYAELVDRVEAEAQALSDEGAEEGMLMPLDPKPGIAFCVRLHAIGLIEATAWIGGSDSSPPSASALVRVATSGTTAEPRTVDLTRGNLRASAAGTGAALEVRRGDRWLCCLPVRHVAGLSIITRSAQWGTAAVVHPDFDVERVARSLREDSIAFVSLVATQLGRLLEHGADLSGPRAIVLGGGPVAPDLVEEALRAGANVVQSYGMTETASQVALLPPALARQKAGSAGPALPGAELRIDNGEILVRGPMVSPSAALDDGWLRTGDLGRIDEDGCLWVDGRTGDLIITGGENVRPEPVEDALRAHPDVVDAAVVGRPDPEWQEAVTAVVVLRGGAAFDEAALRAHCAALLERHEVPKRFEVAQALPRTASGKLRRAALRE